MFFKHGKKRQALCADNANGVVKRFPGSPVNPLYKPRTLKELRALFDHTGINPAPVQLREGIKEIDGIDAMDSPAIPIGGDIFENLRIGKAIENDLRAKIDTYHANQKEKPNTGDSDKPLTSSAE